MNKIIQTTIYSSLILVLLMGTGCKKDFQNPGGATFPAVSSSPKGLMGVAIGIQRTYSLNVAPGIADANGFATGEVFLRNSGNTSEFQLSLGGSNVDGTNALL